MFFLWFYVLIEEAAILVDVEGFIRGLRPGGRVGSSYKKGGAAGGQGWVVFMLF